MKQPKVLRLEELRIPYGLWEAVIRFPDGREVAARGVSARQAEYRCHVLHQQEAGAAR
jgi:hypothetical protein